MLLVEPGDRTPQEVAEYWENYRPRVVPAEQVLDIQRQVMESVDRPKVREYIFGFMKSVTDVAHRMGGVDEVLLAMSSLFWPATDEVKMAGLLRKELFTARTYQVTAEMVEAVTGTYMNSSDSIGHLVQEELPFEAGFVWLDKPFLSTDTHGLTVANRAISWSPVTLRYARSGVYIPKNANYVTRPDLFDSWPGIRLNAWFAPGDQDSYWTAERQGFYESLGAPLLLAHTSTMPFGQRFGGHPKKDFDMTPDDFAHWVHVLWLFMEAEISVAAKPPIPRAFHRRALKSMKQPPAVNVIMLRRAVASKISAEDALVMSRKIDWSVRWIVQGHHRHIDGYDKERYGNHHATANGDDRGHCATCGARITWVHAYLKGPEGLPLRTAEQLYRLAR